MLCVFSLCFRSPVSSDELDSDPEKVRFSLPFLLGCDGSGGQVSVVFSPSQICVPVS